MAFINVSRRCHRLPSDCLVSENNRGLPPAVLLKSFSNSSLHIAISHPAQTRWVFDEYAIIIADESMLSRCRETVVSSTKAFNDKEDAVNLAHPALALLDRLSLHC
jgi:hypothetical protein